MSVRYEGHVQGVGFRYTTVTCASSLAVTGFVKNESDGTVTLVAEGDEDALNDLLKAVRCSSVGRFVIKEHMYWSPATGEFATFDVRYRP